MASATRKPLEISLLALAILLLPILVLTGSEMILGYFGDTGVDFKPALLDDPLLVELTARYRAFAAFVFFVTISLAVTAIFACDVVWRFSPMSQIKIVIAIIGVILVTLVFSVVEPEAMKGFETYELLGEDLFRSTLGVAKTGTCLPDRATCTTGSSFDAMNDLVDISNRIVSLAAAAALAGIILSLADAPRVASVSVQVNHIRDARRRAKRYLYCSGLLLTAGMIWTQAWMSWPAALIADDTARGQFWDMVGAFSIFRGTTYSLLILSVYLPVYLVLAVRVDAFRRISTEEDLEEEQALERISYTEALKTITAIVAPILMSVIGSTWSVTLGL